MTLFCMLFALICFEQLPLHASNDRLAEAQHLYKQGQFAEARRHCEEVLKRDSGNVSGKKLMGTLLLLENKCSEARQYLLAAYSSTPSDSAIARMIAETYYREDNFLKAAPYLRSVGRTAFADMVESCGKETPYKVIRGFEVGDASEVVVKFLQTDPLPLVSISVNGSPEALFIIDTGGSVLLLDPDFAKKVGAIEFGEEMGTFAGGKKTPVRYGRVDSVRLGNLVVQNVPVSILDTKKFSVIAGGKPVSGVLGTVFLYHFLSTIDYPNGQLILRKRNPANFPNTAINQSSQSISVPFWMSGDHFIVLQGKLQSSPQERSQISDTAKINSLLFFVDTGLAGAGFTCPESTMKEATIQPLGGQAITGTGGAGAVTVVPFMIPALSLGNITAKNVLGLAGPFPAALEYSQGYRIGGLVSHSVFRPYKLTFDFLTMTMLFQ